MGTSQITYTRGADHVYLEKKNIFENKIKFLFFA